jgi:cytochrome c
LTKQRMIRLKHRRVGWLWLFGACAAFQTSLHAQEMTPAKRQFVNACGTCHAAEPGAAPRQGPNLFGVIGRPAGQVDGFKYSDVLKASSLVWDEATLDRWLTDAQAALPGTTMIYRQVNPERRKLAIDHLKSLQ